MIVARGLGSAALITQGYGTLIQWIQDVIVYATGRSGRRHEQHEPWIDDTLDWLSKEEEEEFMVIVKIFLTLQALRTYYGNE